MDVVVTGYSGNPFIDGRTYSAICFSCSEVPKMEDFDELTNEIVIHHGMEPSRLNSVKEMMAQGFGEHESTRSIKAVKKALKKAKAVITSETENHIYNKLFMPQDLLDG
jgi:hypothetical protein